MADTNQLKERAVIVRGGSGVAVPAMSKGYAYVLTAFHNVLRDPEDRNTELQPTEVEIIDSNGAVYQPLEIFKSDSKDAAVLLVPYVAIEPISLTSSEYSVRDQVWLAGYPNTRRSSKQLADKYKLTPGQIEVIDDDELIVSTYPPASKREMLGFSGCGVYCESSNGKCILVGIEYRMEGPEDELQRWVQCLRMSVFEKIIQESSYQGVALAPILPSYLLDFLDLVQFSFPLDGFVCVRTRDLIRNLLWEIAREKLANGCPSPYAIKEKFGELLLLADDPRYYLIDKKLWLSWVELLVISVLLDDPQQIDSAYIDNLRMRRRLLYSGVSVDWTKLIEAIARSNFAGLSDNAIVLVTNAVFPRRKRLDLSKIISDIGQAGGLEMDIGLATPPKKEIKLMHLDALHNECLEEKEDMYAPPHQFDKSIITNRLIEAYREAIER